MPKELRVLWPEAAVQLARSPELVQYEPMMVRFYFRSPVDDLTSFSINGKAVESYVLAKDCMSVTAFTPDGELPEATSIVGRPRNLDGAMGRLALRGSHAVVGGEKLVQQIVRLSRTSKGDILGEEELYAKPEFKGVRREDMPAVTSAAFYRNAQIIMSRQRQKANIPASELLLGIDVLQTTTLVSGDVRVMIRINTGAGSLLRTMSWEESQ